MAAETSSSASKALSIFTTMCERGGPCTLAEIVRLTGYSRTVTGRMVTTLVQHGFLERKEETGHYSVDPRLLHLAQKALSNDPLQTRIEIAMREICRRTGDTALYMVESGMQALVIQRTEGTAPVRVLGSRVGMTLPLHCGGAPSALLAFSDAALIDTYLSGSLEHRTEHTCTNPAILRHRLQEIRQRGYSIGQEDLFEYVVALGAPVRDDRNKLVGAISIGNITQHYPPERIKEVGQILMEEIGRM